MSSIARWSYVEDVTVWPFLRSDRAAGGKVYGEPYIIKACWAFKPQVITKDDGTEYVAKGTIWTEAATVKFRDLVMLGASTETIPPNRGTSEVQVAGKDTLKMFGRNELDDWTIFI